MLLDTAPDYSDFTCQLHIRARTLWTLDFGALCIWFPYLSYLLSPFEGSRYLLYCSLGPAARRKDGRPTDPILGGLTTKEPFS